MGKGLLPICPALALMALTGGYALAWQNHKREPKPKKPARQVIILKVVDDTGATGEESVNRSLFARAGILTAFAKKKISSISPVEIQGTVDQLQIDFGKPDNWTSDNFDKLANPWNAEYVVGVTVDSTSETPEKNDRMDAETAVTLWLYDYAKHKFVVEKDSSDTKYQSAKGEEHVDPKAVEYKSISLSAETALSKALEKEK